MQLGNRLGNIELTWIKCQTICSKRSRKRWNVLLIVVYSNLFLTSNGLINHKGYRCQCINKAAMVILSCWPGCLRCPCSQYMGWVCAVSKLCINKPLRHAYCLLSNLQGWHDKKSFSQTTRVVLHILHWIEDRTVTYLKITHPQCFYTLSHHLLAMT